MQLSTRSEDFVVDALALRSHIGPLLGPIFANPEVRPQPAVGELTVCGHRAYRHHARPRCPDF